MFYNLLGYLDPGTGSLILQALIAAIAGLSVAVKLYWQLFLKLLGIKKPNEEEVDD